MCEAKKGRTYRWFVWNVAHIKFANTIESVKDSRPPPGISYEGEVRPSIEEDNTGQHRPPGSLGSHHCTDGEHAKTHHHHHHLHLPKILSKDGVRNALFFNSAATAFTKRSRTKTMDQVDVHLNSLAITGSAVLALWLRRDDKGRRPVSFFFLTHFPLANLRYLHVG